MLGYGLSKVKMLVITGELRSVKDGKYRRILPEWVDEYVARKAEEAASRLISEANQEAHRVRAEGEAALVAQRAQLLAEVEKLRADGII